jgi:hypothetical protein
VVVRPIILPSLAAADAMTGLRRIAGAAAAHGVITDDQRAAFDTDLAERAERGRFFMCGAMIVTVGRVAG